MKYHLLFWIDWQFFLSHLPHKFRLFEDDHLCLCDDEYIFSYCIIIAAPEMAEPTVNDFTEVKRISSFAGV